MTDAPATNELLALADRISATPSYTGKDLRTWRTPILERCDGDGDGNAVSVILVDAKQREVLVKALRAAATPSAEVNLYDVTQALYDNGPSFSWDECERMATYLLGKYGLEKR